MSCISERFQSMTTLVYIVIPVYNRSDFTRNCLNSLLHQTITGHRVIVVDDGSTDGTSEMLAKEFPDVIVLMGSGSLFWTAAINMGIRHALRLGADCILTLNNDTVASENFLEQMIFWHHLAPDSLLGALDVDAKTQRPYYGGEIVDWIWSKSHFLVDKLQDGDRTGIQEVSLYPGRGLLIPKNVFEAIGLFEEKKLPHYLADYDFTLMARRNGFKIYCNYDAKLYTYPEESGDHELRKKKSLKNYFLHLFGIRGGGNLKNFTIYTFRNCPRKYLLTSLLSGYARRIAGYWLK